MLQTQESTSMIRARNRPAEMRWCVIANRNRILSARRRFRDAHAYRRQLNAFFVSGFACVEIARLAVAR